MRWTVLVLGLAAGCAAGEGKDTAGDRPELGSPGAPAALAEKSGSCPDLSAPGISTFTSGGEEHRVGVYFPKAKPEGMPVMFVWHGLTAPGFGDVIEQMVNPFDLDELARKQDMIVVVPESPVRNLVISDVLLWGILADADREADLRLFDDLRSCIVEGLAADPWRVTSWGFSGGGLWNSLLIMDRSDVFAAAATASGGTDQDATPQLVYRSPARKELPVMLVDGGDNDIWPGGGISILDFKEATAAFRDELVADGHYVLACEHGSGHTVPVPYWSAIRKFLRQHVFGEPSPFQDGDVPVPDVCEEAG
ncbi:MAG: hypothetical protein H6732_01285 [Alphaproteobacteria bacterium]|nr:hypothetical protein [Alphaproteobacteria bacterium]